MSMYVFFWVIVVCLAISAIGSIVLLAMLGFEIWVRWISPACRKVDQWVAKKFGSR